MKSGTTFVQENLLHNREVLAERGVLYAADAGRAVHDLLGHRGVRHLGDTTGAWDELVDTVRGWSGQSVVISVEFFGLATVDQARRAVTDLRPLDVQVVLTARDVARTIPSAWQQTTKNRKVATWPEFARAVTLDRARRTPAAEQFWRHHDVPMIAKRWITVVGPEHLTLVTVPPQGNRPELLWERFCKAVDLDADQVPPRITNLANSALGHAEAELIRRLNKVLPDWIDQPTYRRLVNRTVVHQVLRRTATQSPMPGLSREVRDWAVQTGARFVEDLRGLDTRVIGDLSDLLPKASAPTSELADASTDQPDESAVVAAAVEVAAALVTKLVEGDAETREPVEDQLADSTALPSTVDLCALPSRGRPE